MCEWLYLLETTSLPIIASQFVGTEIKADKLGPLVPFLKVMVVNYIKLQSMKVYVVFSPLQYKRYYILDEMTC